MGFAVETVLDATRSQLTAALGTFARTLRSDDVALIYFAGHGVQVDEVNYLIPTDYAGTSSEELRLDAVSAVDVQEMLLQARVAILMLDACRDNPYQGTRSAGRGLAPMEPRGTLIAYAAEAGQQAMDGVQGAANGLFTSKFVEALQEPGLGVSELFRRVRQEVYAASNGDQFPALYDGLLADFVFREAVNVADVGGEAARPGGDAGGAGTTAATLQMEMAFWDSIRESTNPADFEAYRQRFPRGTFVELAANRLEELRGAPVSAPPSRDAVPAVGSPAAVEAALGMDRAARQLVQLGLQREGYSAGVADGRMGPRTRTAIRRWQEARGVVATGYLNATDAESLRVAGEAQRRVDLQRQAAIEAARRRQAEVEAEERRQPEERRQAEARRAEADAVPVGWVRRGAGRAEAEARRAEAEARRRPAAFTWMTEDFRETFRERCPRVRYTNRIDNAYFFIYGSIDVSVVLDPRGDVHTSTAFREHNRADDACEEVLRVASSSVDLRTFGEVLSAEASPLTVFPVEFPQGLQQTFRERESCSQARVARTIGGANALLLAYDGGYEEAQVFGREGLIATIEGSDAVLLQNRVDDVCAWLAEK